jgi:hypothetical protein
MPPPGDGQGHYHDLEERFNAARHNLLRYAVGPNVARLSADLWQDKTRFFFHQWDEKRKEIHAEAGRFAYRPYPHTSPVRAGCAPNRSFRSAPKR